MDNYLVKSFYGYFNDFKVNYLLKFYFLFLFYVYVLILNLNFCCKININEKK